MHVFAQLTVPYEKADNKLQVTPRKTQYFCLSLLIVRRYSFSGALRALSLFSMDSVGFLSQNFSMEEGR